MIPDNEGQDVTVREYQIQVLLLGKSQEELHFFICLFIGKLLRVIRNVKYII
jgi:hypothetical protein